MELTKYSEIVSGAEIIWIIIKCLTIKWDGFSAMSTENKLVMDQTEM